MFTYVPDGTDVVAYTCRVICTGSPGRKDIFLTIIE